jgi:hypothetical protein
VTADQDGEKNRNGKTIAIFFLPCFLQCDILFKPDIVHLLQSQSLGDAKTSQQTSNPRVNVHIYGECSYVGVVYLIPSIYLIARVTSNDNLLSWSFTQKEMKDTCASEF